MRFAHPILLAALASPASAFCTIYEHENFGGAYWEFGDGDRLVMIDDPACFEDDGAWVCTTTNGHDADPTMYDSSWNDVVSSFQVGRYCTITLWEHIDGQGAYFRTHRSYSYVGDDWNDEASEAVCTCD